MTVAGHAAVTSDSAVKSGPGMLIAVALTAGDGAAGTLILYDNTADSGTVLVSLKAPQATTVTWTPPTGYVFSKGCYADIGGEGAAATVVYV